MSAFLAPQITQFLYTQVTDFTQSVNKTFAEQIAATFSGRDLAFVGNVKKDLTLIEAVH